MNHALKFSMAAILSSAILLSGNPVQAKSVAPNDEHLYLRQTADRVNGFVGGYSQGTGVGYLATTSEMKYDFYITKGPAYIPNDRFLDLIRYTGVDPLFIQRANQESQNRTGLWVGAGSLFGLGLVGLGVSAFNPSLGQTGQLGILLPSLACEIGALGLAFWAGQVWDKPPFTAEDANAAIHAYNKKLDADSRVR